jgi:flagellar basal-body rod protein FlgG
MNGVFYIGATGMRAQQAALEATASNIANINTPGFKRSQIRFTELVAPPADQAGAVQSASLGVEGLGGVGLSGERRVFAQGDIKQNADPMSIAIQGDGFIELLGPSGETMLWRGGRLKVNPDGFLAAENGMPLKAMISVPADAGALTIDRSGVVTAAGADAGELGRIELMRAGDPDAIAPTMDGLFEATGDAALSVMGPGEDGAGSIIQGALESSNVELADEMVTLLMMQRAFAADAQVLQAGDQLMAIANGLRR